MWLRSRVVGINREIKFFLSFYGIPIAEIKWIPSIWGDCMGYILTQSSLFLHNFPEHETQQMQAERWQQFKLFSFNTNMIKTTWYSGGCVLNHVPSCMTLLPQQNIEREWCICQEVGGEAPLPPPSSWQISSLTSSTCWMSDSFKSGFSYMKVHLHTSETIFWIYDCWSTMVTLLCVCCSLPDVPHLLLLLFLLNDKGMLIQQSWINVDLLAGTYLTES